MIQIIVLFFRIAVFSVSVLKDERIIIIAEQRPDCTEEEVNNPTLSCIYSNLHVNPIWISCIWAV